jgi:hypothetical protein
MILTLERWKSVGSGQNEQGNRAGQLKDAKVLKRREKMELSGWGKATTRAKRRITPAFEGIRKPRINHPALGCSEEDG